jgi:hypothetical protein
MSTLYCIETEYRGILRLHYFNSLAAVRHFIKTGGRGEGWGALRRASWDDGELTPLGLITDCNRVDEIEGGIDAVLDALEAA